MSHKNWKIIHSLNCLAIGPLWIWIFFTMHHTFKQMHSELLIIATFATVMVFMFAHIKLLRYTERKYYGDTPEENLGIN